MGPPEGRSDPPPGVLLLTRRSALLMACAFDLCISIRHIRITNHNPAQKRGRSMSLFEAMDLNQENDLSSFV